MEGCHGILHAITFFLDILLNLLSRFSWLISQESLMPSANLSAVNSLYWTGLAPTPASPIIEPQNCWSPKKGTTVVGFPHLRPMAVVPAPPWRTTPATLGNSQS